MNASASPRPGLREVGPYESPQLEVAVRLNANECPLPLPAAFSEDLAATVRDLELHRYPDGQMRALREALSARTGHPVDGIWPANGSNEVLTQLLQAYGGTGRRAAVFEPTYLLHRRLCWLTQTDIAERRLEPPFRIGPEDLEWISQEAPDVVFVCSPNNPTGNAQPLETIAELAGSTRALVIVDEAYVDFGGETALPLVAEHPNLAVVRTFSKAFALAGARIGYVLAAPAVVEDLQRVRLPYHLSALTQAAGVTALRHTEEAAASTAAIRDERDRIVAGPLRDRRRHGVPVTGQLRPVPASRRREGGLAAPARSRRAGARSHGGGPERAPGDRRDGARGRPVPEVPRGSARVMGRVGSVARTTNETSVTVELALDGEGATEVDTGLPFFDHMLQQLGKHAGWNLSVRCTGDLEVDGHHTVEDAGLAIGEALAEALGDKAGIRRFASIVVPLDEAAVEVALDLSGRNFVLHDVDVPAETIGTFDTGLVEDFVRAFAQAADLTVHVRLRSGRSPHHVVEAEFKALAKALGDACALTGPGDVPSTKGSL